MNLHNQALSNTIDKRLKLQKDTLEYQQYKYKEYLQSLYSNAVPMEAVINKDYSQYSTPSLPQNLIMNNEETNFKQKAKENLEQLLSVSDSQKVLSNLSDTELKRMNQLFPIIKSKLIEVKFYNTDEFLKYLKTFIKQQLNEDDNSLVLAENKNYISKNDINENFISIEEYNNFKNKVEQRLNTLIMKNVSDTYDGILTLINNIQNSIPTNKDEYDKLHEKIKNYVNSNYKLIDGFDDKKNKNRKGVFRVPTGQTSEYYNTLKTLIIQTFINQQQEVQKIGNGLNQYKKYNRERTLENQGLNPGRRLIRNKNIKIGNGVKHFIKGSYYIDINSLNDNVLQIKYVKTGNIKNQVGINDNTKQIINQMINNQYNPNHFLKLNENEKKIIYYVNTIFKFVDNKNLVGNPIDDLFEKFEILKGSFEAGNDNKIQIDNLKKIALELLKYKKLSKVQVKNLFFDLDNNI